jgi:hypothetical protein
MVPGVRGSEVPSYRGRRRGLGRECVDAAQPVDREHTEAQHVAADQDANRAAERVGRLRFDAADDALAVLVEIDGEAGQRGEWDSHCESLASTRRRV